MASINNTPRPAYVYDTATNEWIPIGVGAHSHNEIPKTVVDAKGDLIVGTAADTVDRLAVGSNGQTLVADSSQSTGLKWATPSYVGVKCFKSAVQSIPNATWTTLTFDSESFDTDAFHDNTTNNSRITIPTGKAGKYLVNWQAVWVANNTGSRNTRLLKNGTTAAYGSWTSTASATDSTIHSNSTVLDLAVGDYLEIQIGQASGGALDASGGATIGNTFGVTYMGA